MVGERRHGVVAGDTTAGDAAVVALSRDTRGHVVQTGGRVKTTRRGVSMTCCTLRRGIDRCIPIRCAGGMTAETDVAGAGIEAVIKDCAGAGNCCLILLSRGLAGNDIKIRQTALIGDVSERARAGGIDTVAGGAIDLLCKVFVMTKGTDRLGVAILDVTCNRGRGCIVMTGVAVKAVGIVPGAVGQRRIMTGSGTGLIGAVVTDRARKHGLTSGELCSRVITVTMIHLTRHQTGPVARLIIGVELSTGVALAAVTAIFVNRGLSGRGVRLYDAGKMCPGIRREIMTTVTGGSGPDSKGCGIGVWLVASETICTLIIPAVMDANPFFIVVRRSLIRRSMTSGTDIVGIHLSTIVFIEGLSTTTGGKDNGGSTAPVVKRTGGTNHEPVACAVRIVTIRTISNLMGVIGRMTAVTGKAADKSGIISNAVEVSGAGRQVMAVCTDLVGG